MCAWTHSAVTLSSAHLQWNTAGGAQAPGDQSHPQIHQLAHVWDLGCMLSSSAFTLTGENRFFTLLPHGYVQHVKCWYSPHFLKSFRSTDQLWFFFMILCIKREETRHINMHNPLWKGCDQHLTSTWLLSDLLKIEINEPVRLKGRGLHDPCRKSSCHNPKTFKTKWETKTLSAISLERVKRQFLRLQYSSNRGYSHYPQMERSRKSGEPSQEPEPRTSSTASLPLWAQCSSQKRLSGRCVCACVCVKNNTVLVVWCSGLGQTITAGTSWRRNWARRRAAGRQPEPAASPPPSGVGVGPACHLKRAVML